MPFQIVREDITKIKTEAIVNPTDQRFSGDGGTDRLIHEAAGRRLDECCADLGAINTGEAVITESYDMDNTSYIIHTVGPVYINGFHNESRKLRQCYRNCLDLAKQRGISSIAFPLISTGSYGFPKKKALKIAQEVITDFLLDNEMDVYLLVYDREAFSISRRLYRNIENYLVSHGLSENYSRKREPREYKEHGIKENRKISAPEFQPSYGASICAQEYAEIDILSGFIEDESFNECLRRLIREKELIETDVYKRSNLTKQAFNNIYNNGSVPKKGNVLALAIGMKLSLDEAEDFIEKAGYSFGRNRQDFIVRYFIEHGLYDIYEINNVLMERDLPYLGSKYE